MSKVTEVQLENMSRRLGNTDLNVIFYWNDCGHCIEMINKLKKYIPFKNYPDCIFIERSYTDINIKAFPTAYVYNNGELLDSDASVKDILTNLINKYRNMRQ